MTWQSLGKATANPEERMTGHYLSGPKVQGPNGPMATVDVMALFDPDFEPAERIKAKIQAFIEKCFEDELGIPDESIISDAVQIPLDMERREH
jgi:hypothetical protein